MMSEFLERLQIALVEPPRRLEDIALRYRSRLLNIFLLIFILVFAGVDITYLITTPGYVPPWYGYVFLFAAYGLNKAGQYSMASLLTIAMFPLVIFANIVSGTAGNPLITLYYLIPGLIFGGILLSIRSVVLFALAGIAMILSMPYFVPDSFSGFSSVIGPFSAMVICAVLVLVSMRSRDQIEKERQAELREGQERLRFALDAARMGTWNWNVETGAVSWSGRIETMFGMQPGEFDEKYETYLSLIHPHDLSTVQDAIARALSDENADYLVEHRLITPQGETRWLEGRGKVHRDNTGKPVRMAGTVVDITDRKHAEEALRQAQENYRDIVEHAVYGIFQSEPGGRFLSVNTALARIYGFDTPQEMLRSIDDISAQIYADPSDREKFIRLLQAEGVINGFEARNRKKDGSIIWISSTARAVRDAAGNILYFEGTVEDITGRKEVEADREHLLNELASKNAELERFVYTVSHDLKAPLVTIVGFLGYLEEDFQTGNTEALHKDIERVYRAAFKMQDLLQDLLDLSRIGRMMNDPEYVSFNALVTEALELTEGRLNERGVEVQVEPGLPAVYGDAQRLLEVVQNLIDNAAKYMGDQPNPRIEIGCRAWEQDKPVFFVRDNGIGVASEHHEQIFGLFNKLDPNVEGTGIGLALVKRIVEFHEGRIWVESEPGSGATFLFTLPVGEKSTGDVSPESR